MGGVAAALTYLFVSRGQQAVAQDLPHLGPGADYSWPEAAISAVSDAEDCGEHQRDALHARLGPKEMKQNELLGLLF